MQLDSRFMLSMRRGNLAGLSTPHSRIISVLSCQRGCWIFIVGGIHRLVVANCESFWRTSSPWDLRELVYETMDLDVFCLFSPLFSSRP